VTSLVLTLRAHYSRFAGSASPGTYAPRDPAHVRGAGSTAGENLRPWTRQSTHRGASA